MDPTCIILPKPYPDELFYSVVARYINYMDGLCVTEVLKQITPILRRIPFAFAPPGLSERILFGATLLHPEEIRERLTLSPIYDAYQSTSHSSPRYASREYFGSRPSLTLRKVCLHCMRADLNAFGESFWRRSHQCSGVFVCVLHGTPLYIGGQARRPDFRAFRSPEQAVLRPGPTLPGRTPYRVAALFHQILNSTGRAPIQVHQAGDYRAALQAIGFLKDAEHLDHRKLHQEFVSFIGESYLSEVGLNFCAEDVHSWFRKITSRAGARQFPPLQHVLLQVFLASKGAQQAVAQRSLRCGINVPHIAGALVTVRWRTWRKRRRALVRCSCGSLYSSEHQQDGRFVVSRLISPGAGVIKAVHRQLETRSVRATAALIRLPRNAVTRLACTAPNPPGI